MNDITKWSNELLKAQRDLAIDHLNEEFVEKCEAEIQRRAEEYFKSVPLSLDVMGELEKDLPDEEQEINETT